MAKKKKDKQAEREAREAALKAAAEAAAKAEAEAKAAAEAAEAARLAELITNPPPLPPKKSLAIKRAKVRAEKKRAGELGPKKKFVYTPEPAAVPVTPAVPLPPLDDRPAPKTFAARLLVGQAAKAKIKLPDGDRTASRGNRPLG